MNPKGLETRGRSSVLITGANGFIGGHFARRLVSQGTQVRALVREASSRQFDPRVEEWPVPGLFDRKAIRNAAEGVDTVIHLAGRAHILHEHRADPLTAFRAANVEGTRSLLEAAEASGVRRFLLMSSVSALGTDGRSVLDASTEPKPSTPYGISKFEAEEVVRETVADNGMAAVIMRSPGVFGPGMKGNILRLFRLVHNRIPVPVPTGHNRRSLLYVDNLVEGCVAALDRAEVGARTFLIAQEPVSTRELVYLIGESLGVRPRVVPLPFCLMQAAATLGDVLSLPINSTAVDRLFSTLEVDSSELYNTVGYGPQIPLRAGLYATANWYLSSENRGP